MSTDSLWMDLPYKDCTGFSTYRRPTNVRITFPYRRALDCLLSKELLLLLNTLKSRSLHRRRLLLTEGNLSKGAFKKVIYPLSSLLLSTGGIPFLEIMLLSVEEFLKGLFFAQNRLSEILLSMEGLLRNVFFFSDEIFSIEAPKRIFCQ